MRVIAAISCSPSVAVYVGEVSVSIIAVCWDIWPVIIVERRAIRPEWVEPISKSSEEDNEAGELDKAEEVLSVILPADEDATLPLYPGEEALDEPAPLVTA